MTAEFENEKAGFGRKVFELESKLSSEEKKGSALAGAVKAQGSLNEEKSGFEADVEKAKENLTAAVKAKEENEVSYVDLSGKVKEAVEMVINANNDSVDDPVATGAEIIAGIVENSEERMKRKLREKRTRNNNNKKRRRNGEEEKGQKLKVDAAADTADTSVLLGEANVEETTI